MGLAAHRGLLVVPAVLVATLATGCGGGGSSGSSSAGGTDGSAASPASGSSTPAPSVSSPSSAASGAPSTYRVGAKGRGSATTLRIDKVQDPADASAPWGAPVLTSTHYVALDVTVTVSGAGAGAVNGSCFSAKDSKGKVRKVEGGMTTKGAHALDGLPADGSPVSGQLVFEVPDGATLATLTSTCDGPHNTNATVALQ